MRFLWLRETRALRVRLVRREEEQARIAPLREEPVVTEMSGPNSSERHVAAPGFKITGVKGFHITFENGWTVSVQFGGGNYSDNYDEPIGALHARMRGRRCVHLVPRADHGACGVNGVQKMVKRSEHFRRHRHGGKRIPNFVRPEERDERTRPITAWFDSVADLFGGRRGRR